MYHKFVFEKPHSQGGCRSGRQVQR